MGTIFGSFFTLAVYRIPRKENIIYIRSHCTSCNHRLEFWDLIPVFSYVFLGGKCRYCKDTIRSRYLILELLSGLVFVLIALAMNITVTSTIAQFLTYGYVILIFSVFCILMGIGKNVNISVVMFGVLIRTIFLFFMDTSNFLPQVLETMIFIAIALTIYLVIDKLFSKIKNDTMYLDKMYPNIIGVILLVGLLIYIFGLPITTILMGLGIVIWSISKYIFKRQLDSITYIMLVSICALILISNDMVYENILIWFRIGDIC